MDRDDRLRITGYIRWLIRELEKKPASIDKDEVKTMLLSVIGELYRI